MLNIKFLLSRLYFLRNVDSVHIVPGSHNYDYGVHIYAFSSYTRRIKDSIAQLYFELFWYVALQMEGYTNVQLIIDEYQHLQIADSAIEELVREGRRKHIGVVLLSQFECDRQTNSILEQAKTQVYFRMVGRDGINAAKLIDYSNYKTWASILSKLDVGECVLCGSYTVDGRVLKNCRPVICKVQLN